MTGKMMDLKNQINGLEAQVLDSQKDCHNVFDTLDLIMEMDDVKDELRAVFVEQYGEVPENMKNFVRPMYVMTNQWVVGACY